MKIIHDQAGFTLIELLLAMTLFSTVMVIATVGFIGMNRTFTRGVIRKELSEASQKTIEDITQSLRASAKDIAPTECDGFSNTSYCKSGIAAACFDGTRYFWNPNEAAAGGLYKDTLSCNADPSSAKITVVNERFKVRGLKINPISGGSNALFAGLFTVKGALTSGDSSAFNNLSDPDFSNISCKGSAASSAVRSCSVEKFNLSVSSRR